MPLWAKFGLVISEIWTLAKATVVGFFIHKVLILQHTGAVPNEVLNQGVCLQS